MKFFERANAFFLFFYTTLSSTPIISGGTGAGAMLK